MEQLILIFIMLVGLLPYGYILSRIISNAHYQEKLQYHHQVLNQLGGISMKSGGKVG